MTRHTILIVDDDQDTRDVLGELLEMDGYTMQFAASGEEALLRLATLPHPDCVLLDVVMPGIDGWRVLEIMRADPSLADVSVVAISASGAGDEPVKPDAFVRKPFSLGELIDAIERTVTASRSAREEWTDSFRSPA